MKWLIWRARVAFWFRRLRGMPFREGWAYSADMGEFFTDEYGPCHPRDAVEIEASYWEY